MNLPFDPTYSCKPFFPGHSKALTLSTTCIFSFVAMLYKPGDMLHINISTTWWQKVIYWLDGRKYQPFTQHRVVSLSGVIIYMEAW